MSNLINITDEIEYVYLTIPKEYVGIYHKLLVALSDYGEDIIKDCNCLNKCNNKELINCWNLFQSAIACYTLNEKPKAEFFIKYIDKQLKLIYKGSYNEIYNGSLPLSITEDGKLKALVTINDDSVKFEVDSFTGRLIQENQSNNNYSIENNNLLVK